MPQTAERIELKPETLRAFTHYIDTAETELVEERRGTKPFLWSEASDRIRKVSDGTLVADRWSGQRPIQVPNGLIHDWVGAVLIPATTAARTLELLQDYDHHSTVYQPEVIGSRLIGRNGDDFQIYLRLRKKKIITVILDTDHEVHYYSLDDTHRGCCSKTTRVAEVENAGRPNEVVHPADTGYGYLWRLNSEWRFAEQEKGVIVECRAISLTRDIPRGLAWAIEPMIDKLPRESLKATLDATRRALCSVARA